MTDEELHEARTAALGRVAAELQDVRHRVDAAIKLCTPDDLTLTGARIIHKALWGNVAPTP